MTERQAPYKITTPVAMELPDEFIEGLIALRRPLVNGDTPLWLARGRYVAQYVNGCQHGLKMILYQKAADVWDVVRSTVTEDLRNSRDLGEWVDEMPEPLKPDRTRLRYVRQEAAIRKIDPLVVLQEQADDSDNWGGQLCPLDKLRARVNALKNGKKPDDGEDVLSRLHGASSALATALKRANGKKRWVKLMPDLMTVSASIEDLLEKAEGL